MSACLKRAFVALICFVALSAGAVARFDNRYYSPRNGERPIRKSTSLIVLHTTEAPSSSALKKLSAQGECNYCIAESGIIYRIIDRRRESFHAGRSMWNGRSNVDEFSVGIEVCGYHDKPLKTEQYRALRDLIAELKAIYKLGDRQVVTHSQVAYGTPNKWFRRNHRGRKRCGMAFALPSVRKLLGLNARATVDPDVRAGRLTVGDPFLNQVLYGRVSAKTQSTMEASRTTRAALARDVAAKKDAKPQPKPKVAAKPPKTPRRPKVVVAASRPMNQEEAEKPAAPEAAAPALPAVVAAPPPKPDATATQEVDVATAPESIATQLVLSEAGAPGASSEAAPAPEPAQLSPATVERDAESEIAAIVEAADADAIGPGRSAWDIARSAYNAETTVYTFPDGSKKFGHQIVNFKVLPAGTTVKVADPEENLPDTYQIVGINGNASGIAGDEALSFNTIYIYPDGKYYRGSQLNADALGKIPYNTKVLVGYEVGGPISARLKPFDVCGARWNAPDTFYLRHGVLVSGDKIDPTKMQTGTMLFFKN